MRENRDFPPFPDNDLPQTVAKLQFKRTWQMVKFGKETARTTDAKLHPRVANTRQACELVTPIAPVGAPRSPTGMAKI